jgi:glycosidase
LPYDDDWSVARFSLPPGEYGYLIARRGERFIDVNNPLTTFADETEVSLLLASDCSSPAIAWQQLSATEQGDLSFEGIFLAAAEGDALDPDRLQIRTVDGRTLNVSTADPDTGRIEAHGAGFGPGKHTVVVDGFDDSGVAAESTRGSAWIGAEHSDWRDAVLYQVMLDRFRADDGSPLSAPATPGARAGGTLNGLTAEIERGEMSALGVTALWISPVYVNPDTPRAGNDGRYYEGYHGYWPLDSRAVDPRLGGEAALESLVATAHAHGLRVLLDLVPNHVYEDNPRYRDHADDGWFSPACVCGQTGCPWGSHLQTCWFTPYLPDLRFRSSEAMRMTVQDATWWAHGFDIDGVRVDAVPMMPRAASRRIAHGLRTATFPPAETFMLGEVYTGPGTAGLDQIRRHLGPAGFDSLFDFPLMWALRDAIASGRGSFATVEDVLRYGETSFAGSGAVLARMLDNHDTSRFVSVAHGDAAGDPWDAPAVQPTDAEPYQRLRIALAALFTLPGMPVLFQGDEVGLAGAGDPDCRRVMPAPDQLSSEQRGVRDTVRSLARLRRCSTAMRRGDRVAFFVKDRVYGYLRGSAEPHPVLTLISSATTPSTVTVPAGATGAGAFVDVIGGDRFVLSATEDTELELEPLSYRILLSDGDPCQ